MPQTILIVEDEPQIVAVLEGYLGEAGFRIETAFDGVRGLHQARSTAPDLVILDLMLPGMDGIDVAREIRRDQNQRVAAVPIIMLTAKADETDKIIGLEIGADDYIAKPFSPREVVARVRAMLRRLDRSAQVSSQVYKRGPLVVDRERLLVSLEDRPIELTPTEFDILATMAATPGRPFTRMELLEATSGDAYEGYERTIDVHIKNLRRKLGDSGRNPRFIQTVLQHGYRFAADVNES